MILENAYTSSNGVAVLLPEDGFGQMNIINRRFLNVLAYYKDEFCK